MLTYATPADLAAWSGNPAGDEAKPLLRHASVLVARACRNDLYDVDSSGKPSDPDIVEAMRDAACAQAEFWQAAGIDPAAGASGVQAVNTEVTVDGATVKRDTTATVAAASAAVESITALTSTALGILRNAGLASGLV